MGQLTGDWSREKKAALFCMGLADDLRADGLLDGGPRLTESGRLDYEELKQEGFEVTKDEMKSVARYMGSKLTV